MDAKYKCEYCGSKFTRNSSLVSHINTAKYCLKIQGQVCEKDTYECGYCNKVYIRPDKYKQHIRDCRRPNKTSNIDILHMKNQQCLSQQIAQLQSQIMMLMSANPNLNNAGNINNRNVVVNNLQPITDAELQQHIEHLTLDFILEGAKGYADFANNYPFKDRVLCTDKSRKKLKYRGENGEVIDDPYGKKLTQRFFQSIAERNNELVNNEYQILQQKVAEIAAEGTAASSNLAELLTKSVRLQDTLRLCNEAASGCDNELTQGFINHLTKQL